MRPWSNWSKCLALLAWTIFSIVAELTRVYTSSCFYLLALLFSPTWHFSLCRHRTSRNVSRVATAVPFYSRRRKMRAREDEGIIIYIAVKPEFHWALSSGLNVNQSYDVQVVTRIFPFTCNIVSLLLYDKTDKCEAFAKVKSVIARAAFASFLLARI